MRALGRLRNGSNAGSHAASEPWEGCEIGAMQAAMQEACLGKAAEGAMPAAKQEGSLGKAAVGLR